MDQDCIKYASWMLACQAKEAAEKQAAIDPVTGGLIGAGAGALGGGVYSLLKKKDEREDGVKRLFRNMLTGGLLGGGVGAGAAALPGLVGEMDKTLNPTSKETPNKPSGNTRLSNLPGDAAVVGIAGVGGGAAGAAAELRARARAGANELPKLEGGNLESALGKLEDSGHARYEGLRAKYVNDKATFVRGQAALGRDAGASAAEFDRLFRDDLIQKVKHDIGVKPLTGIKAVPANMRSLPGHITLRLAVGELRPGADAAKHLLHGPRTRIGMGLGAAIPAGMLINNLIFGSE